MARAQGARAQMALAFETVYGTAPASGYTADAVRQHHARRASSRCSRRSCSATAAIPLAPIKDAMTADGDVVVPIDAEAFGFWLKAAFGAADDHRHRSLDPRVPLGRLDAAVAVDRDGDARGAALRDVLGLRRSTSSAGSMQRSGLLTATARAGGAGRDGRHDDRGRNAGRAGADALRRTSTAAITRNGAALGNVVSAEITYANNLDRIETIRERRSDRRRRPVDRRAHRPRRGALRRPGAGEPGDRRRPLRARVRLRAALGRELHAHGARRLPAAAADRDRRDRRACRRPSTGRRRATPTLGPHVHRHARQRRRGLLTPCSD